MDQGGMLSSSRRTLLVGVATFVWVMALAQQLSWRRAIYSYSPPPTRFSAHWLLGELADGADVNLRTRFPADDGSNPLVLQTMTNEAVRVVARAPSFVSLQRRHDLPAPPRGSVFIDRPPDWGSVPIPINCLRT